MISFFFTTAFTATINVCVSAEITQTKILMNSDIITDALQADFCELH